MAPAFGCLRLQVGDGGWGWERNLGFPYSKHTAQLLSASHPFPSDCHQLYGAPPSYGVSCPRLCLSEQPKLPAHAMRKDSEEAGNPDKPQPHPARVPSLSRWEERG